MMMAGKKIKDHDKGMFHEQMITYWCFKWSCTMHACLIRYAILNIEVLCLAVKKLTFILLAIIFYIHSFCLIYIFGQFSFISTLAIYMHYVIVRIFDSVRVTVNR